MILRGKKKRRMCERCKELYIVKFSTSQSGRTIGGRSKICPKCQEGTWKRRLEKRGKRKNET